MSNNDVNAKVKINTIKKSIIMGSIIIDIIIPGIIRIINRIIGITFGHELAPISILSPCPRNNRTGRNGYGNRA